MSDQYVIVGGGQAGNCAALSMRAAGFSGRIVIVGAEIERPYERPPLSKDVLTSATPSCPYLSGSQRYDELGIDLVMGSVVSSIDPVDQRLELVGGGSLPYGKLLIATGGRARRLNVAGGQHVHYLRDYADALRLRAALGQARRVLCIGAGVIGLEIASSARSLSCDVVVVEAGPHVMGRSLTSSEVPFVEALHRTAGVDLRLSTGVDAVEAAPDGTKRVVLSDGSIEIADCVIAGVGMERNTELAAAAGLDIEGGIVVDASGRTSTPNIFAAGDVAAFWHPMFDRRIMMESWHHAQDHGGLVGRVMAGVPDVYEAIPRFWTDQHDINLQAAGLPGAATVTVLRGDRAAMRYTAFHLSDDSRLVAVTAVNNGRDMSMAMRMIRHGRICDRDALADANVPLKSLAA